MSVYPPYGIAPAVGEYKTVELTLALRIAGKALSEAAEQVAPLFTAAEWEVLAQAFKARQLEPELSTPGPALADYLRGAHSAYGLGADLAHGAKPALKAVDALAERVAGLSYMQAWAVLIATRFRWARAEQLQDGETWWELATRWRHQRPPEKEE